MVGFDSYHHIIVRSEEEPVRGCLFTSSYQEKFYMRFLSYAASLCALLGSLVSCVDLDDFNTSPTHTLAFASDTLALDTVMCGTPGKTYMFSVKNHASKAVRIPRVWLGRQAQSAFRVNVDGEPLADGTGSNFEIAANDSMLVFLFAHLPAEEGAAPVAATDSLYFITEAGVEQHVVLRVVGQPVTTLSGKVVEGTETLTAERPYHITDSLVVAEGATLMLQPGCKLLFRSGANLVVHGSLLSLGTHEQPVVMRSDRLDYMFVDQPYDRVPGGWGGVVLASESYDNYLSYTDIHGGDFGLRVDSSDVTRAKLTMENSIVHNTQNHALDIRMANVFVGNSQITNAGGICLKVRGGDVTLVHCTLGSFSPFSAARGTALDFANFEGEVRLPLTGLQFGNCIITGYKEDEIMGAQSTTHTDDAFAYAFYSCLLNTPKTDPEDPRMLQCLYDQKPAEVLREKHFANLFDSRNLISDFRLAAESPAIGTADAEITAEFYPTDMNGVDRLTDAKPDMGCYQYVAPSAEEPAASVHRAQHRVSASPLAVWKARLLRARNRNLY